MNAKFIRETFPKVKFAFLSNYNHRRSAKHLTKGFPVHDFIFAVENNSDWHKQNFLNNKKHYQLIPRHTFKHKMVAFFQQYGAKIHFNYFKNEAGQSVRYGVIEVADLKNDLLHWESLVPSSIMQKPMEILIVDQENQVLEWQKENLKSAFAFSTLVTPQGSSEFEFYENIVRIPTYQCKKCSQVASLFNLLDKVDPKQIVEQNIEDFRKLYHKIRKEYFGELVDFDQKGRFIFLKEKEEARKELIGELNDNLIRNLKLLSAHSYDEEKRIKKSPLKEEKREKLQDKFLLKDESKQIKQLQRAIDKILIAHRNTRIFLVLMGKVFFITLMLLKYTLKVLVLYFLYQKKSKNNGVTGQNKAKIKAESAPSPATNPASGSMAKPQVQ